MTTFLCFQQFLCDVARDLEGFLDGASLSYKPLHFVAGRKINSFWQFLDVQIDNSFHIFTGMDKLSTNSTPAIWKLPNAASIFGGIMDSVGSHLKAKGVA